MKKILTFISLFIMILTLSSCGVKKEIKEKVKPTPDYRLTTNIKTDKDGDTIVVLYVSYVGTGDKVQYFIKPEKGQLTSDHKDLDPAKIISKIEVTLKDRTLTQTYREEQ